jgi:hypothetical protein
MAKHEKPSLQKGALPRDKSKAAPSLESYLTDAERFGASDPLPAAYGKVDRESAVTSWPMYRNDQLGDCTVAGILHGISAVEAFASPMSGTPIFSDDEVTKIYSAVSGYDPATGANDNGATLADVCRYMVKTGAVDIQGKRHQLLAWAEIENYTDLKLLKRVLNAFGTTYLAIDCPVSAMDQFQAGEPWTLVKDSPSDGGHAIPLQYNAVNTGEWNDETVITWATEQKMSEGFAKAKLVEAVAIVPAASINPATGLNPAGLDLHALVTDCQTKFLV